MGVACKLPLPLFEDPREDTAGCSGENQEVPEPEGEEDGAIAPGDHPLHPQGQQH